MATISINYWKSHLILSEIPELTIFNVVLPNKFLRPAKLITNLFLMFKLILLLIQHLVPLFHKMGSEDLLRSAKCIFLWKGVHRLNFLNYKLNIGVKKLLGTFYIWIINVKLILKMWMRFAIKIFAVYM